MNLIIITGTTKGLGAALRDHFAADAGNVVICLSRAPASEEHPVNIEVDLQDTAAVVRAFDALRLQITGRRFERAVLINNAGVVGPVGRFDHADPLAIAANIQVNLTAPMVLAQAFANALRGQAAERLVVHISSGAAKRAIAGWSAYCAAKAGLEMATRVAALEVEPGLAICSLAPGVVDTPMQAQVRLASEEQFPDVARFREMKADGTLRDARAVATHIAGLIEAGRLTNGGNFDIRELAV